MEVELGCGASMPGARAVSRGQLRVLGLERELRLDSHKAPCRAWILFKI